MIYPPLLDLTGTLAGAGLTPGGRDVFSIRNDIWEDVDGTVRVLLLLSKHGVCLCILLCRDPVNHHDPEPGAQER